MNFLSFLTLSCVAVTFAASSPLKRISTSSRLTEDEKQALRERISSCNANVCFAIDGSGSNNATECRAELNFVLDIVSIITVKQDVELAAVQYGIASSPISPLTIDFEQFILNVQFEEQLRSNLTFVSAGINYCFSQLWRRRDEANKIVLLGDGRSFIGADAAPRADFSGACDVCTVAAGFSDVEDLLDIAGGGPDRVFQVDNFLDVLELEIIIETIVADICELEPQGRS